MPSTASPITIEAPSRLHLGMFAFGESSCRRYGGVGLMIREPRLRIIVRPAAEFSCTGLHIKRAAQTAQRVAIRWMHGTLPKCELAVESAPREHVGLGLGTQLTLAVGIALTRFSGLANPPSPHEMAVALGRARRSTIGTHGFVRGGLLVDAGHAPNEPLGPLVARVDLPESWRVLLVIPHGEGGLCGSREAEAFEGIPPVPPQTTGTLAAEVLLQTLPAAQTRDFHAFAESVHRFGRFAGGCFAVVQGGPYACAAAPIVDRLRQLGVEGVAQSSWGPTVFALAESDANARSIQTRLENDPVARGAEIIISRPDNRGAVIS